MSEPRIGMPPPPPNNSERVKKKRGRPPKARPVEVSHLPPEPEDEGRQLIRADGSIDGDVLLDLFLANISPDKAQELFGVSPDNFKQLLGMVSTQTLDYVETVLTQLTLKNLARSERLMATWMPLAQEGLEKAAKTVIDLIRLERDLLKDAQEEVKRREQPENAAGVLDTYAGIIESQIDSTFVKGSPMYEFALSVLSDAGGELVDFTEAMGDDPDAQD